MIRLANFARWIRATNTGTNIDSGREQTHSARAACPLYKGKEQIKLGLKAGTVGWVTGSSPRTFHGGKFFLSSRREKRHKASLLSFFTDLFKPFEDVRGREREEEVGERIAMELDGKGEQGDPVACNSLNYQQYLSVISPLELRKRKEKNRERERERLRKMTSFDEGRNLARIKDASRSKKNFISFFLSRVDAPPCFLAWESLATPKRSS